MRLSERAITIYKQGGVKLFFAYSWKYLKREIIKKRILYPLITGLREILAVLIPTKPGLVLFGFTTDTGGNSGLVYKTIVERNVDEITPVWVTSDKSRYEELSREGYPVVYRRSVQGQLHLLRAEVACYDGVTSHTLHNRVTKIKIRHEVPIKDGPEAAKEAATPTDVPNHDYIITTSDFLAQKQYAYHRARKGGKAVRRDQFVNLGFPRNDILFDIPDDIKKRWETFVGDKQYDKIILYAPTRRRHNEYETKNTDIFPFEDFDFNQLTSILETVNALLLIRPHPSDNKNIELDGNKYETVHENKHLSSFLSELCSSDRIRLSTTSEFDDTNEMLQFTDILLTDYSTVYHTYLLFDRPILFIPYDYKEFNRSFGFKYDYFENLPGPAVDTFEELTECLVQLHDGSDPHREARSQLRDKIHDQPDGNSTERVIEFIEDICDLGE